jgi:hypothetical protein
MYCCVGDMDVYLKSIRFQKKRESLPLKKNLDCLQSLSPVIT